MLRRTSPACPATRLPAARRRRAGGTGLRAAADDLRGQFVLAGWWSRVGAYLIDGLIVGVGALILFLPIVAAGLTVDSDAGWAALGARDRVARLPRDRRPPLRAGHDGPHQRQDARAHGHQHPRRAGVGRADHVRVRGTARGRRQGGSCSGSRARSRAGSRSCSTSCGRCGTSRTAARCTYTLGGARHAARLQALAARARRGDAAAGGGGAAGLGPDRPGRGRGRPRRARSGRR